MVISMTEVFDMNMSDLFGEDSEFIEGLKGTLTGLGVEIDANSLATILHEYEMAKMDFLKVHIMRMLESRGEYHDGPVKVVVSQSGINFEPLSDEEELEPTNVPLFS